MNTTPISDDQTDDLHLMMAAAILCGQRGVETDLMPIFDSWAQIYPQDALANIGRGLHMIGTGNATSGYEMIAEAARSSATRAEQARDVLASLAQDLPDLAR
ncbi:hypothetical protein [Paracoccus aminophilus]|uniref:Type III secretion system protein n=1 Tax=Paracoccus aminophilus JCM 7686 TaxID=1367847 RepID=S5XZL5_PARAH|nr:hypothetical protein [Paracoccus aminophilus]AGT08885.1 type III secretion system protein [Paracoccus aminophilus JCM 7686]